MIDSLCKNIIKKEGKIIGFPHKIEILFLKKQTKQNKMQEIMIQEMNQIKLKTYRYTYSNEFIKELEYFSKIHKYDDRKTFKEEWNKWINEEIIKNLIEIEKQNILNNGYEGDIMDKIFKSTRYYFRKKKENENKEKNENNEKEEFTGLSKKMIQLMNDHINMIIRENIDEIKKISKINPSKAYTDFCNTHVREITDEIFILKDKMILKAEEINIKFKKSYKNKFYKIRILLDAPKK